MTEEKKQLTENQDSFIMHPTVDFCFKELMENAKVRQGLIAAILKKDPEEIQKTKLMPTILRKEYPEDKYGILDVRVLLKNGEQMDLEMQVVPFEFWFQRSFYYLSKMVTDQMKTGDTYDRIKPCIHVGILDFNFFENDTRCYHAGMFCDKETGEVLTDLLQIHILELKKLPPESQNETGIIQWMRFMSGKNRKDFAKMAEQNEYIKEAYECLEKMSADERKRREYEERQKILWDHNSFMKSAKIIGMREGREEGRKEGREEGRKEGYREALVSIVIKKLQKGMSAEEIADFLEEDVLTIQRIYDIANTYAPEYDIEKIVQKLGNTSGMKQK